MALLGLLDVSPSSTSATQPVTAAAPATPVNPQATSNTDSATSTMNNLATQLFGESEQGRADSSSISSDNQRSAATYDRRAGTDVGAGPAADDAKSSGYSTALRTVQNLAKMTKAYSDTASRAGNVGSDVNAAKALGVSNSFAGLFAQPKDRASQFGFDSSMSSNQFGNTNEGQLTQSMAAVSAGQSPGGSGNQLAAPTGLNEDARQQTAVKRVEKA